jgi:hypothetical protein
MAVEKPAELAYSRPERHARSRAAGQATGRPAEPSARRARLAVWAGILGLLALGAGLAAGCGGGDNPVEVRVKDEGVGNVLGFPVLATKNTTRVAGEDPVQDAAGVATAVYPAVGEGQRPAAVTLVDKRDWRAGLAAAALAAAPLRTPILLTDGGDLPTVSSDALDTLGPRGSPLAGRAQVFEVGDAGSPEGFRVRSISGRDPFELAAKIDSFRSQVAGEASANAVVVAVEEPRFAMPAAAWAAKSGDPVLFVTRRSLPRATRRALADRERPGIYVLGPRRVIAEEVLRKLRRLGPVTRISGETPVENAIAFARFSDGLFGWGIRDPGHGLVIANSDRPLDAAAAALLSASGTYGPLLLTDSDDRLPALLRSYLLDIQPGYRTDPVRGVYNHAWLIGDESALSVSVQTEIDELTEIVRVRRGAGQ